MENLYSIHYTDNNGETIGSEFSCGSEVEAALWFVTEFKDEIDLDRFDDSNLEIEQVGYTFYGEEETYDYYRGLFNADDELCWPIKWCYQDLMERMAERGIPVTDENIEKITNGRFGKTLHEVSIQYGWEIMNCLIDYAGLD